MIDPYTIEAMKIVSAQFRAKAGVVETDGVVNLEAAKKQKIANVLQMAAESAERENSTGSYGRALAEQKLTAVIAHVLQDLGPDANSRQIAKRVMREIGLEP